MGRSILDTGVMIERGSVVPKQAYNGNLDRDVLVGAVRHPCRILAGTASVYHLTGINMPDVTRTTRECALNQLNPKLLGAIQEYFQCRKLGALNSETCLCSETVTDRSGQSRWMNWLEGTPDELDYLALILTEQRLLWARAGETSKPIVMDAELKDIVAREYKSKLAKESGLEIAGNIGESRDRVRGKFALGAEPAAKKFIEEVVAAVDKAAPPPKPREIPWLSFLRRK